MKRILLASCLSLILVAAFAVEPASPASPQPRVRVFSQTAHIEKSASGKNGTLAALGYAAMIATSLLALLMTWPASRAWIHVFSGNYDAAIQIYEKELARQPHRLPLYLTLTNLYQLAGRHDQRARTAYAMIELLHLAILGQCAGKACQPLENEKA